MRVKYEIKKMISFIYSIYYQENSFVGFFEVYFVQVLIVVFFILQRVIFKCGVNIVLVLFKRRIYVYIFEKYIVQDFQL